MAAKPLTVFVAGTFDGLHAGHLELFEFARRKGARLQKALARPSTKLHVIVARDANVEKTKGKVPLQNEVERLRLVKSLRQVDAAMLGHPNDFFASVRKIAPDLIVLGHDQSEVIEAHLRHMGYKRIVRGKPYLRARLKSSKLKKRRFEKSV